MCIKSKRTDLYSSSHTIVILVYPIKFNSASYSDMISWTSLISPFPLDSMRQKYMTNTYKL